MKSLTTATLALLSLAFVTPTLLRADEAPKPAPAWELKDLDGNTVKSEQFKGKVVVLDFWATWCGPCRSEIPGYVKLQKKYGSDGLVIVGASVDQDGPAVVKEFVANNGVDYRIVMADDATQAEFGDISAIPTTFIIDRDGMIRFRKVGSMPTEDFEKQLVAILKPAKS